ncbi:hypothetical protein HWV62_13629 [Athelia sp. TMB]|nr:hypothetical protein HWV62_13629 [Athelia sp. TMB]
MASLSEVDKPLYDDLRDECRGNWDEYMELLVAERLITNQEMLLQQMIADQELALEQVKSAATSKRSGWTKRTNELHRKIQRAIEEFTTKPGYPAS